MFETGKNLLKLKFRRGRQLFLFLFCLFLAFIIWVVHNLSDEYSRFFEYKVFISVQIKGHETVSGSLNNLVIRGKSNGFYILKHRYASSDNFLNIKPDEGLVKKYDGDDGFYLLVPEVRDLIVEAVAEKMTIEYFSVDTLFFCFPNIAGKEVPVSMIDRLSFRDQYMPVGDFKLNPSHVFISGERERLKDIDTLYTDVVVANGVDSDFTGFVNLDLPEGISASEDEVYYTLDVARFVEQKFSRPLEIIGLPDSLDVELVPEELKVVFRYRKEDKSVGELDLIYPVIDFKDLRIISDTIVEPGFNGVLPDGLLYYGTLPRFVYVRIIKE
jgi:hypothetical protein